MKMNSRYLVLAGIVIAMILMGVYVVIEHYAVKEVYVYSLQQSIDRCHTVEGVYVYTDKESYVIGDIITLGIANEGNKTIVFPWGTPWELQKKENGEWISLGARGAGYDAFWRLKPGQRTGDPRVMDKEYKWDTSDLTPGRYRIVFYDADDHVFIKEFTIKNS